VPASLARIDPPTVTLGCGAARARALAETPIEAPSTRGTYNRDADPGDAKDVPYRGAPRPALRRLWHTIEAPLEVGVVIANEATPVARCWSIA